MDIKHQLAKKLMDIKAIKLQPNDPFTWASGWKSPIYTDNRKTLSYSDVCAFVCETRALSRHSGAFP